MESSPTNNQSSEKATETKEEPSKIEPIPEKTEEKKEEIKI